MQSDLASSVPVYVAFSCGSMQDMACLYRLRCLTMPGNPHPYLCLHSSLSVAWITIKAGEASEVNQLHKGVFWNAWRQLVCMAVWHTALAADAGSAQVVCVLCAAAFPDGVSCTIVLCTCSANSLHTGLAHCA